MVEMWNVSFPLVKFLKMIAHFSHVAFILSMEGFHLDNG